MKKLFHIAIAVSVAATLAACSRRPLRGANVQPGDDPAESRRAGVRDFPRLVSQLTSALGVSLDDAALMALLNDRFGVPAPPAGTTVADARRLSIEYIAQTLYQSPDQRRSVALEASRLRLVGAFCQRSVSIAKGLPANDPRRGIFHNVNLGAVAKTDAETFLRNAGPVFRRDGKIPTDEVVLIADSMSKVAAGAASVDMGWTAGCVLVAGESEAGEL